MSITMSAHTDKAQRKTTFKVVVVGQRAVGKTSLAIKYVKGIFSKLYAVTVGIEFHSKIINYHEQIYNLQIWDTAGQQSFKSLIKSFYNQACCIIIAYSNPKQINNTFNSYLNQIQQHASEQVLVFAVRTKIDLIPLQAQQSQILQSMKYKNQIKGWLEVSSKQSINVDQFFQSVEVAMIQKYHQREQYRALVDAKKFNQSISLSKQSVPQSNRQIVKQGPKKKRCCH